MTNRPKKQKKNIGNQSSSQDTAKGYQRPKVNYYNKVINYRKLTELPDFKAKEEQLKNFILYAKQKVLFIFGPSGCGKSLFIDHFMKKYKVEHQYRREEIVRTEKNEAYDDEFDDRKVKKLREVIMESLGKTFVNCVDIYMDFPIVNLQMYEKESDAIKRFRNYFFTNVSKSSCKMIFILNSEIYNRYQIIPKNLPQQISTMTFKSYTITEVKNILKEFVQHEPHFQWIMNSKDTLDQIIQLSDGDMRKVLLNVYKFTMKGDRYKYMSKSDKAEQKFQLQSQKKVPFFHLVGKYLYGKRLDPATKTQKYYTKQQLEKLDPPFYFNPVESFKLSGIPLSNFVQVLFQNYSKCLGTVEDLRQITKIFAHLDTFFPSYITTRRWDSVPQEWRQQYLRILTWGIILKNKSSKQAASNAQFKIRKPEWPPIGKQLATKKQIIRRFFPFYNTETILTVAWVGISYNFDQKLLMCDLITKRNHYNCVQVAKDEDENLILNEDDEKQIISRMSINIEVFMRKYIQKKSSMSNNKRIKKICLEEQKDTSDIDEQ